MSVNNFFKNYEPLTKSLLKNKHFKFGLPFFLFMGLGVFILTNTQSLRFEFKRSKNVTRKELIEAGVDIPEKMKTLEEMYEDIKKLDVDNWENVRIPRPWDETVE